MGWIFKYTFMSFTGDLFSMGQDMDVISGTFDGTASAWGANLWIIVAIVASFAIMSFGIAGGIEKANKVMMPILFFLFVGLGIYIAFLPGASDGYKYIFKLDPKGLANPLVWIFAFGQAFFPLSVAGNGSVIYGSYLPKNENLPGSARNVAIFDTLAALLAAFVIIPAMAAGGAPPAAGGGVTGDGVADAVGTGVSGAGETDASGVVSGEGVGEAVNSGRRSSAAINAATYLVSGPQVLMY